MTLDDYFEKTEARKLLVENLKTNNDVLLSSLAEEEKASVLRMNLIMIRQCMEAEGLV